MSETSSQAYPAFPKIGRLTKKCLVTEKINGTNGMIRVHTSPLPNLICQAGSRNRWLTPESDNFGFAKWVAENARDIANILGPGDHYGEWAGPGIQKNPHDLNCRHFFVFPRHVNDIGPMLWGIAHAVIRRPLTLYDGPFSTYLMGQMANWCQRRVAEGHYMEGFVILHESGWRNKWTLNDGHKGSNENT